MQSAERETTLDDAVARWNALVTANFPALKHSLEAARGGLGDLAKAIEERRILSRALLRESGHGSNDLEALAPALAGFHVELEALTAQINRTLTAGFALQTRVSDLAAKPAAPIRLVDWDDAPSPNIEIARLRKRVAELEEQTDAMREALESMDGATAETSPVVYQMQDEIVRLRQTMEVLQLPDDEQLPTGNAAEQIRSHAFDAEGKRRPMGLILVKAGVITTEQLEAALSQQRNAWNRHLGAILVDLGFVEDEAVAQAIAAQTRVDFVRLSDQRIDREAASLVSRKMALHHMALPIAFMMNDLVVAMANPLDLVALEDLKLATGRPVHAVVATTKDLQKTIDRIYGPAPRG
jgi:predicted nuclease with TOPRIM domain